MATFFSEFPSVDLDVLGNGNVVSYTDLFRFVDVNDVALEDYTNYQWYEIQDGERPDNVSYRLYNTANFYWTFFIVNDRLKNGYKEWPLSSFEFENYIQNKYNGYGVAIIPPGQTPTLLDLNNDTLDAIDLNSAEPVNYDLNESLFSIFGYTTSVFSGENSLNGLNYKYSGLRVKRSISTEDAGAKIVDFDSRKFQLWVEDIRDRFFFSSDSNQELTIYLTDEDETANLQWLIETRDGWLKNLAQNYNLYTAQYNSIVGTNNYATLKATIEPLLKFNASKLYDNAANVPRFYVDVNGDPLCPLYCVLREEGIPRTNYELEEQENFEKRKIRVIDPSVIRRFANRYRQVLRSTNRLTTS